MKRKLLYILNPKAGKGGALDLIDLIKSSVPKEMEYSIEVFKDSADFTKIISSLHTQHYTDAIAVGGDGTINSVAKNLVGTDITLGIIPQGSGNGLARTLGISMDIKSAMDDVIKGNKTKIDHGTVNGIPFFCTSGIGFDAHIGNLFAQSKKRGLQSYVKITLREILRYKCKNYILKFNGEELKRKAYLITIANAGQYGNDFYIAPQAKLTDGKFHVVILKPFNFFTAFGIFIKVLRGKANESKHIETYVTDKLSIEREGKDAIHFDGEPEFQNEKLEYICYHQQLNVIIGKNFKP
jgi:YegS/Rv2252/BmrU family lipid kinase